MNVAVIFAGGTGQRMNTKTLPKQFLELHAKPIIIYTLEQFDKHSAIDAIVVVCLEKWIPYLKEKLIRFDIKKVVSVVPGGASGQESIYNGLCEVERLYGDDAIVLIHDGVRPMIDENTITANIDSVLTHGNAITAVRAIETIVLSENTSQEISSILDRNSCMLARAPQSFFLKDILRAHRTAISECYDAAIDSAMLMNHYGYDLHLVMGNIENIKVTTPSDFYVFRAYLEVRENSQIMGI